VLAHAVHGRGEEGRSIDALRRAGRRLRGAAGLCAGAAAVAFVALGILISAR
jgi:hypothetical protein